MLAINPRQLKPSDLARLLNSTPLGTVIDERELYRHRVRAGFQIGEGRQIDLYRYVAWLIERKPLGIDGAAMLDWRDYEIDNHVPNCGGCLLSIDPEESGWRVSRSATEKPRMDAAWRVPGRAYQVARDPERLLIEERAEALSVAGYPLPGDDPAMYAEQRLKAARAAASSSQVGSVSENTAAELSAREVCQVLREVTFERRTMTKVSQASWDEIYAGHFGFDCASDAQSAKRAS